MSEIKLNLVDARQVLNGTIHGSIADSLVAALSAEPETLAELEAALARFIKPLTFGGPFATFQSSTTIDDARWDAGIVVIDLAARIVAMESTYSQPGPKGEVYYHDGKQLTDVPLRYQLPDDWVFLDSISQYKMLNETRRSDRAANPPLDARAVLYGRPLLEWIVNAVNSSEGEAIRQQLAMLRAQKGILGKTPDAAELSSEIELEPETNPVSKIHARWLMTPRADLRGQPPREVLFAKRDLIDLDLSSRELQWSFLDEGPPCLSVDSFAYRFAGFGTHEWVIYYDLVRHLIWSALELVSEPLNDIEIAITQLEERKLAWLEQPLHDFDTRIPAVLLENERKRLPIAMSPREMIVDENCPTCQMFADETALGLGVGFWHLDGCNMDDDFVFSYHRTREEWEAERLEWQMFSEKFNREWEEKQQRIARGEAVDSGFGFSGGIVESDVSISDSSDADEHGPQKLWGPRGWSVA